MSRATQFRFLLRSNFRDTFAFYRLATSLFMRSYLIILRSKSDIRTRLLRKLDGQLRLKYKDD